MNNNNPTWIRPAKTAGIPPAGTVYTRSAPGAAASRYNGKDTGIGRVRLATEDSWEETQAIMKQLRRGVR